MKMLVLLLTFFSLSVTATDTELSDDEIHKQHMSVIKDAQIDDQLSQNDVFSKCRDENKFDPKDTDQQKQVKLDKAKICFNQNLPKDPEELKKLSNTMELHTYGLVNNKDSNSIVNYLSNKITKALTGVDPEEKIQAKRIEDLKFGKSKIVDQRVFLDLYTNQLVKSALFEVSRFCFQNLQKRLSPRDNITDIQTYWSWDSQTHQSLDFKFVKKTDPKTGKQFDEAIITDLSDQGNGNFIDASKITDFKDKEAVYSEMMRGLGQSKIDPEFHKMFFKFCQTSIKQLCSVFRQNAKVTDANTKSMAVATTPSPTTSEIGANACLTMDRLSSVKENLRRSELVGKQFDEMGGSGAAAIKLLNSPTIYARGKGQDEESLDDISNMASSDIIGREGSEEIQDLEKKCTQGSKNSECDQFLIVSDNLDKAISNLEHQMNLKREIEVKIVKELKSKNDIKGLEEYLKEKGMFDLIEKIKTGNIEDEITRIYDARKVAEIDALRLKVGKRQMSEDSLKKLEANDPNAREEAIKNNIEDIKTEKIRMAQVLMFNNIITSTLDLYEKDGKTSIGRNVGGWKKEYEGLKEENSFNPSLFAGIQSEAENNASKNEDTSIAGGGIIDSILGKMGD